MLTNRRPLTLLHTADVHLGLDFDPLRAERAFEAVISLAIDNAVDAVIIAGDLFDHNRVTAREVDFAAAQINRLRVPCVVMPGNHDQYDDGSVHRRIHLPDLCGPVHMLTDPAGSALELSDLGVTFWGRPVVDHCPEFRPLEGAPGRAGGGWHVALAHGFHVPRGEDSYRSSPVRVEEIEALGWDYLAMGHVHRYWDVSAGDTVAVYPGSSFTYEAGADAAGSAALVTLDPTAGVSVQQLRVVLDAATVRGL